MGWTLLYVAFGIVALWLLGEVLLQYKARLRWRVLAFTGFMGVVLGVLIPSVLVIALGTTAFAVGQVYVTLSFRRGFSAGWAVGGRPCAGRRRGGHGTPSGRAPALEVSDLEYAPVAAVPEPASLYATEPMPDDTGQYGAYKDSGQGTAGVAEAQADDGDYGPAYAAYAGYQPHSADQGSHVGHDGYAGQDGYPGQEGYANPDGYAGQDGYANPDGYARQDGYGGPSVYPSQYDYGTGEQQYAAYSDPYIGSSDSGQQYGSYNSFGDQERYADPYGDRQRYAADTPPGGVWVPQQRERDRDPVPPMPGVVPPMPEAAPPVPGDSGFDEQQYRF
jgi:hypothetical protein